MYIELGNCSDLPYGGMVPGSQVQFVTEYENSGMALARNHGKNKALLKFLES